MQQATATLGGAPPPHGIYRYPASLVDRVRLADGRSAIVRPVLPQDAELQRQFFRALSPKSRYQRFHGPVAELPEPTLRSFSEIDYVSHLALLAAAIDEDGDEVQIGEARWIRRETAGEVTVADFALAVADDWQGVGLGSLLLRLLMRSAAESGIDRLCGDVLADNVPMRKLLGRHGWAFELNADDARSVAAAVDLTISDWATSVRPQPKSGRFVAPRLRIVGRPPVG